jgi:hypothetical protein
MILHSLVEESDKTRHFYVERPVRTKDYSINISACYLNVLKPGFRAKMTVFWNVAPCSLVEADRRFSSYCLHHQGDISVLVLCWRVVSALMMETGRTSETSVNFYLTASHPRK